MTIAIGQHTYATTGAYSTATSVGPTASVTTNSGSAFAIAVGLQVNGGASVSGPIVDSLSNSYALKASGSAYNAAQIYLCDVGATGGSGHNVEVYFTAATPASVFFMEVTGAASPSYDVGGGSGTTAQISSIPGQSLTTSAAGIVISCAVGYSGGYTFTDSGTGFSILNQIPNTGGLPGAVVSTNVTTGSGTYQDTYTASSADYFAWAAIALKQASGVATPPFYQNDQPSPPKRPTSYPEQSQATELLFRMGPLGAKAISDTAATANLGGAAPITAAAISASASTANLAGTYALSAAAISTTAATANLGGSGALVAAAVSEALGTANLGGAGALSAAAISATAVTANNTNFSAGSTTAAAISTTAATANLGGSGALAGAAISTTAVKAQLGGTGALTGAAISATTATAIATNATAGGIAATALSTTAATANLVGAGSLAANGISTSATTASATNAAAVPVIVPVPLVLNTPKLPVAQQPEVFESARLLFETLTRAAPFSPPDLPNPVLRARPNVSGSFYNGSREIPVIVVSPPFYQNDQPNPNNLNKDLYAHSFSAVTIKNGAYPFSLWDQPNPNPRPIYNQQRESGNNYLTLGLKSPPPFYLSDQPNPPKKPVSYQDQNNSNDLLFIKTATTPPPFNLLDQPNPSKRPVSYPDQNQPNDLLFIKTATTPVPFFLDDQPNPSRRPISYPDLNEPTPITLGLPGLPPPFRLLDQPNPARKPIYYQDDNKPNEAIFISTVVPPAPLPFGNYDWPVVQRLKSIANNGIFDFGGNVFTTGVYWGSISPETPATWNAIATNTNSWSAVVTPTNNWTPITPTFPKNNSGGVS